MKQAPSTFCSICTEDAAGRVEVIDGVPMFVCARCATEHPRRGGHGLVESRGSGNRSHAKKGTK